MLPVLSFRKLCTLIRILMNRRLAPNSEPLDWMTLSQAAQALGIHPSTLRRWADQGEIPCVRTPGGHRRFRGSDLRRFLDARTEAALADPPRRLARSLVLRTRREMESERIVEAPWHAAFSEEERVARRASGRRLLGLAIQFTSRTTGRQAVVEEACGIGRAYGIDAAERGLSLVDTLKAFFFFREALIRSARPGLLRRGQYDAEDVHIHRSLRAFLDKVLFAAMGAYEQALPSPLPPSEGLQ